MSQGVIWLPIWGGRADVPPPLLFHLHFDGVDRSVDLHPLKPPSDTPRTPELPTGASELPIPLGLRPRCPRLRPRGPRSKGS